MATTPRCLLALAALTPVAAQADHAQNPKKPALEIVEVHAQQLHLDLRREQALTPGGVTVIDTEQLYQRNMPNLADMLRYAPGVWTDSATGGDSVLTVAATGGSMPGSLPRKSSTMA